jgi:hypothetical protein
MTAETSVLIPNHRSQTSEYCQLMTLTFIKMLLFHIGRIVVVMITITTVCLQFTLVEIPFALKPFKI